MQMHERLRASMHRNAHHCCGSIVVLSLALITTVNSRRKLMTIQPGRSTIMTKHATCMYMGKPG